MEEEKPATSLKRNFFKPAWPEVLLLGLCAAICSIQIFVPPYIGLANNGDFPKVAGRFGIGPPDGGERNFNYFVSDYEYDPKYLWKSDVQSSENVLAAVPILAVKAFGSRVFNIRWLGALHLLLFLCSLYAVLLYLRRYGPVATLVVGGLAVFILTDVAYVAYFNSFFSDTAALLGLLLMVALALHLLNGRAAPRAVVWLFTAAALLFITSKSQHALWGVFPAALLVWRRRYVTAAIIIGAEAAMLLSTPWTYPTASLFSVIFYKLAPNAADPRAAVREVGLGPAEYRYIGTHAYSPGNPGNDLDWLRDFSSRTSHGKVLRYWLRHPRETAHVLYADLATFAPGMRQTNLANFRREDGAAPLRLTDRFAIWSRLREKLYKRWPLVVPLWYAAVIGVALSVLKRQRTTAAVCLGVAVIGVLEFCFASLADAVETERHLFLFHAATEITICFAAAWTVNAVIRVMPRRASVPSRITEPCYPTAARIRTANESEAQ